MNTKKTDVNDTAFIDEVNNDKATKETINKAAWRTIEILKQRFSLSMNDMQIILGGLPLKGIEQGLAAEQVELNEDVLQRISVLLAIYKRLRLLFDQEEQAYSWIDRPNSLSPFNGVTPLSVMLCGHYDDLLMIAAFLDSFTRLTQADDLDG